MNAVVFCPNFVGDIVMATPTFRALRRGLAGARLIAVIRPNAAPTLDGSSFFDGYIPFYPKSGEKSHRTLAVLQRLRAERPDLAILFPNSIRSGLMAWLSGAPRRIGYARGGRGLLLTDRLIPPPNDPHGRKVPHPIVEYYLKIARYLNCPIDSLKTELHTTEADEAAADRAWNQLGLPRDEPVVCLNTGGAFGPAKNWPTEHFATLARRFATEAGLAVLVVCGPSERDNARAIVAQADHPRVVSLADQPLGIGLTKACVRRSALLITTDSGPRHFAAPFHVPVLTLFGPTHIAWTRTYHPQAVHLFHPVPCGPCQKPVCPLGHHRCMRELSPQVVYEAALRMVPGRLARAGT